MFDKITTVLSAEELLDVSFKKTKKIKISDKDRFYRKKKTIIAKIESFSKSIIQRLDKYVKTFPSIDNLPEFYQELIDIKIDVDKLKKSLGAVNWAKNTCEKIFNSQIKNLRKSKDLDFLIKKKKEIYGRISSVIKQIKKDLDMLIKARDILRYFPVIEDIPTVVIAGFPNVGKSSILRCLSHAKPKIAVYPFTTKEIYIGHIQKTEHFIEQKFQIIDTPGLLDRPLSERNKIEKQAIAALKYLADIIVFVIDSSETCGYSCSDQKKLLSQLEKMFEKSKFIIVENKSDIKKTDSDFLKISCENNKGIDELVSNLFKYYPEK